jgi:hypothetical protein
MLNLKRLLIVAVLFGFASTSFAGLHGHHGGGGMPKAGPLAAHKNKPPKKPGPYKHRPIYNHKSKMAEKASG